MRKLRVFLTAGDESGWAIDEDLRLLTASLAEIVELTPIASSEVVHAVWWNKLIRLPKSALKNKHVFCYADNAPFHYITEPEFIAAREIVTTWIARSSEAMRQFEALGLNAAFAPY